jgi:hypothetical protein
MVLAAHPASAVIRFDHIVAEVDTLALPPEKVETFRESLRTGGDLSTVGTYLFTACLIAPMLVEAAASYGSVSDPVYTGVSQGCAVGSQAAFAAMAVGNIVASRASRLDNRRSYALNSRLLPMIGLFVSTWGAAIAAHDLAGCWGDQEDCHDQVGLLVPKAVEILLAPVLRFRYSEAATELWNLHLKPTPRGAALSLAF